MDETRTDHCGWSVLTRAGVTPTVVDVMDSWTVQMAVTKSIVLEESVSEITRGT